DLGAALSTGMPWNADSTSFSCDFPGRLDNRVWLSAESTPLPFSLVLLSCRHGAAWKDPSRSPASRNACRVYVGGRAGFLHARIGRLLSTTTYLAEPISAHAELFVFQA